MFRHAAAIAAFGALLLTAPAPTRAQIVRTDQQSGTNALLIAVSPVNDQVVWVAGARDTWLRTTDGGATWQRLAGGLPVTDVGRIGLAISHTNGKRVYAVVEGPAAARGGRGGGGGEDASAGGVYRTDDGGNSWTHVSSLDPRPM